MKLYRSMLFVPGHRADWIDKAPKYGADALLIDLEDGVPIAEKNAARRVAAEKIPALHERGVAAFVRINALETNLASDDIEAVVTKGLQGIMVPKLERPQEVLKVDAWIEHFERKVGLEAGSVKLLVMPETALGIANARELAAAAPRVGGVPNGIGARAGDVAKAIGYKWTPGGQEVQPLLSHILLANRAAGIEYPLSAGVLEVKDIEQTRRQMQRLREIGYRGVILIHPSAVPIAHEIFTVTNEEIAWHKGVLEAVAAAEQAGHSVATYDGMMVDYAHVRNALDLLRQARSFGIDVGTYPDIKVL